jgi:hypothetical protein
MLADTLHIEEKGGRGMFAGNMVEGSSHFLTGGAQNCSNLLTVNKCMAYKDLHNADCSQDSEVWLWMDIDSKNSGLSCSVISIIRITFYT